MNQEKRDENDVQKEASSPMVTNCDITALSNLQTDPDANLKENEVATEAESSNTSKIPAIDESLTETELTAHKEDVENKMSDNDEELPDLDSPSDNDASLERNQDATNEEESVSESSLNKQPTGTDPVIVKKEREDEVPELLGSAKEEAQEIESEVYCAKCHDGGDMYCCLRCPKVYHLECYIPPMKKEPPDDWVDNDCLIINTEIRYN